MKVVVVSVVRDRAMYERCIATNPHLADVERVAFDNREKNEPIPVLYNRFLDGYDYDEPAWFVFCHEDFQMLEPLAPLLETADTQSLWGPVGVRTDWRWWGLDPHYCFFGRLEQCAKDGSGLCTYGKNAPAGTVVETFDCMCVIVHSSLLQARHLRFDERFAFDLYAEDFCISAAQAGVISRILPLVCRHWSHGTISSRYREAERVFAVKWPNGCYTGTSSEVLGGGVDAYRRIMLHLKFVKRKICASMALRGMGWSLMGRLLVKVVQFGFSIVLARLLCPADFGLVGMLAVFMALGDVLMDGGLVAALIRKKDRTESDYATVFWSKLVVAMLIYGVLFVCAPMVASFYGRPELTEVMRVFTLGLVVVSASSVFHARLMTNGRFRELAIVSALSVLFAGIVGVVLAWWGFGVWAVVGQGLAWHVFNLGLLVAVNRWVPRAGFSIAALRAFFAFGWKHLARGILDAVYGNAYSLVIGKAFGATDLGLFNRADYYTGEAVSMVSGVANEVNYPLLSKQQDDDVRLRRSYHRLQALIAFIIVPVMMLLAIFAEPLILLVIGERWLACVPLLRILTIGAVFSSLAGLTYLPMYVKGRTDLALKLELIEKPIAFGLLLAAIPFGILAICVAKSISVFLFLVINSVIVEKVLWKQTRIAAD